VDEGFMGAEAEGWACVGAAAEAGMVADCWADLRAILVESVG
jgi:hypothetical protein